MAQKSSRKPPAGKRKTPRSATQKSTASKKVKKTPRSTANAVTKKKYAADSKSTRKNTSRTQSKTRQRNNHPETQEQHHWDVHPHYEGDRYMYSNRYSEEMPPYRAQRRDFDERYSAPSYREHADQNRHEPYDHPYPQRQYSSYRDEYRHEYDDRPQENTPRYPQRERRDYTQRDETRRYDEPRRYEEHRRYQQSSPYPDDMDQWYADPPFRPETARSRRQYY